MGILLDSYKNLVKEAEVEQVQADLQEKVDLLSKYAEAATELLSAEFPNDFDKTDVVELADKLIQRDLSIAETQEKTAQVVETLEGYVKIARALLDEEGKEYYDTTVEKLASALFEIDAENQFYKEAEVIAEASFVDEFNKLAETNFTTFDEIEEAAKLAGLPTELFGKAKSMLGNAGNFLMDAGKNAVGKGRVGNLRGAGALPEDLSLANKLQAKGVGVMAGGLAGVGGLGYAATRGGKK